MRRVRQNDSVQVKSEGLKTLVAADAERSGGALRAVASALQRANSVSNEAELEMRRTLRFGDAERRPVGTHPSKSPAGAAGPKGRAGRAAALSLALTAAVCPCPPRWACSSAPFRFGQAGVLPKAGPRGPPHRRLSTWEWASHAPFFSFESPKTQ